MRRKLLFLTALVLIFTFVLTACNANSTNNANMEANMNANTNDGGNGSGGEAINNAPGNNAEMEEPAEDEPMEDTAPALKVSGMVETELSWAEEEVRAMDTIDAVSTNKDGEESTYTGVPIMTLLEMAQVKPEATTIVFVADDGYTAEVSLEELSACTDCIISFRNNGGFSTVLPGFAGSLQVKGVVEIQVN